MKKSKPLQFEQIIARRLRHAAEWLSQELAGGTGSVADVRVGAGVDVRIDPAADVRMDRCAALSTCFKVLALVVAEDRGIFSAGLDAAEKHRCVGLDDGILNNHGAIPRETVDVLVSTIRRGDSRSGNVLPESVQLDKTEQSFKSVQSTFLGDVHQALLESYAAPTDNAQEADVSPGSARHARKKSGNYFTRNQLAQFCADRVLMHIVDSQSAQANPQCAQADPQSAQADPQCTHGIDPAQLVRLRIIDPAMGGASFLLAIYEKLVERVAPCLTPVAMESFKVDLVSKCLYGVDLDPLAVLIGRLSLWLATANPRTTADALGGNLRCGNALIGCWSDEYLQRAGISPRQSERVDEDRIQQSDEWCRKWFARPQRFFHWRQEFKDVFDDHGGFDIVIGNPPWEIQKPNSREFFRTIDSAFYTYGKQFAVAQAERLIKEDPLIASQWHQYVESHKSFATFVRESHREVSEQTRPIFRRVGNGDINAYKLFIELSCALTRCGGAIAQLVPAGIYADRGCSALRQLLLDHFEWKELIGFENTDGTFDIHRSFKYCLIVAVNSAASAIPRGTSTIECSFMQNLSRLQESRFAYKRTLIEKLSPSSGSIIELDDARDAAIVEQLFSDCRLIGTVQGRKQRIEEGIEQEIEQGADQTPISFDREFDMTNDSHLFHERDVLESEGYRPDIYGHWLKGAWKVLGSGEAERADRSDVVLSADGHHCIALEGIKDVALPLFEGRMVGQFDFAEKEWISGKGRTAVWRAVDRSLITGLRESLGAGITPSRDGAGSGIVPGRDGARSGIIPGRDGAGSGIVPGRDGARSGIVPGRDGAGSGIIPGRDGAGSGIIPRPQYLIRLKDYQLHRSVDSCKVGFLAVGSATNTRSMICTALPEFPCGNSVGVLRWDNAQGDRGRSVMQSLVLAACLNSFVFDFALRLRLSGNNLNYFVLQECPLPPLNRAETELIAALTALLCFDSIIFAGQMNRLITAELSPAVAEKLLNTRPPRSDDERLRIRAILEALIAEAYGLDATQLAWILRECHHESEQLTARSGVALPRKGFWRVDKQKPPDSRLTNMTLKATHQPHNTGWDVFSEGGEAGELCRFRLGIEGHSEKIRLIRMAI